jgi:hypothetical protein
MAGYSVNSTFTFTLKFAGIASLRLLQRLLKQIMHFEVPDPLFNLPEYTLSVSNEGIKIISRSGRFYRIRNNNSVCLVTYSEFLHTNQSMA